MESAIKEVLVLVKNDYPKDLPINNGSYRINACGNWAGRARSPRFASECLYETWRQRPSLIISTHLHFGPLAQLAQRGFGTPYVLVAHGIDAWGLNNASRQKALRNANLVLAVSHYTRERLINETGIDANRVKILPNTFAQEKFKISPKSPQLLRRYGLEATTPVILTVCRLAGTEGYKGYDQIIKALPEIRHSVPNVRYLLVGKGSDRPRIEKLIAEVGVQETVILAGFVPDEELADHYNLCDIFAMPSQAEGFGIVYLEALACGKPVLAGSKDGSRDALADGELGLLVNPDDKKEIAAEIIRVLRREHSHPQIFYPEILRQQVIELFGFEAFRRTVGDRLAQFLDFEEDRIEHAPENHREAIVSRSVI
jgi:glycosyltransferase involved in cell wall biosynthesis